MIYNLICQSWTKILFCALFLLNPVLSQDPHFDHSTDEVLFKSELLRLPAGLNTTHHILPDYDYEVLSYKLDLEITLARPLLIGAVTMHGLANERNLETIKMNLENNMTVDSVHYGETRTTFAHQNNILTLNIPKGTAPDNSFAVTIFYHGDPDQSTTRSFAYTRYGSAQDILIWTLSEPYGSPAWWPCKDDPADKADSVDINITVAENLYVASNGLLTKISTPGQNKNTFHWKTRYPISTYLVSLAISNYARFSDWYITQSQDSMEIQYYVLPEQLAAAKEDFSVTSDMMTFYSSIFGEYPFVEEKYGMAVFGWGGAMEHQTITSYGAGLIRGDHYFDYINAHELAHHWFGDMITMRHWSHIWLNEGFASYAEALWFEHLGGKELYDHYMMLQWRPKFNGPLWIEDSLNVSALFSGTVYDKGSWTLHMLRGVMGDAHFFAALKEYATNRNFIYATATTEDFRDICESVSGQQLDWFFDQWVYRTGRPVYNIIWNTTREATFETELIVVQRNLPAYTMPITIDLYNGSQTERFTIWNDSEYQRYVFQTDFLPTDLVFDPDNHVLKTMINEPPDRFYVSDNYPNPFNAETNFNISITEPDIIRIEIYNVLGQKVYQDKQTYDQGFHTLTWNGKNSLGNSVPSGMYFSRIISSSQTVSDKLVLLR